MKIKHIVLATTMMVTLSTFAQKDELKALKKIYAKEVPSAADIVDYKSNISKLETSATEEGDKVYTQFYKCMLPVLEVTALGENATSIQLAQFITPKSIEALAVGLNATLDYEKKTGKKVYTDDINETIGSYKPIIINFAYALANAKKDKDASQVLYSIYQLDKKDVEKLYYAANYAVMAKDFDAALDYYTQLKAVNYSGEGIIYVAKNLASGNDDNFNSKEERDNLVRLKTHISPREEKIPSRRGEIYSNIALILLQKDRTEEAKTAIVDAIKLNPDDTSLVVTEIDLYVKAKDFDTAKKLMKEAFEKYPNDATLVNNLGIFSSQLNNSVDAEKYYSRVIEIDPTFIDAYLNIANIKLQAEKPIVDEMNKLTTSDKDTKRYEVLKKNRETLYKSVLPYYEKAYELKPDAEGVADNLLSVYNFLEMTDKYKALKATKK